MMVYPVCSVLLQNFFKDFTRLTFWRFSVTYPSGNGVPGIVLFPTLGYVVECTNFQASMVHSNYHTSVMKTVSPSYASFFPRLKHPAALQIGVDVEDASGFANHFQLKLGQDSAQSQIRNQEGLVDNHRDSSKSPQDHKERWNKRKGKHGNKGRVPWNKGKKHTAETRALIKQRTIEALRHSQVRKNMSQYPRTHSDEVKKKIGSSLRRLWGKRLKWKRLREKFYLSWTENIAEAARKGGIDQQELDWDSYDRIVEEITHQWLQCVRDKAKAKELAKLTAERSALAKAEKMARLAQKRTQQEEEGKEKAIKEAKKKADKLSVVQDLALKQRLKKIRKKKSLRRQVISHGDALISHSPTWKKLDAQLMKREKVQREVSLADEIQAAKNKRTDHMARDAVVKPFTDHYFHMKIARVSPELRYLQQQKT